MRADFAAVAGGFAANPRNSHVHICHPVVPPRDGGFAATGKPTLLTSIHTCQPMPAPQARQPLERHAQAASREGHYSTAKATRTPLGGRT